MDQRMSKDKYYLNIADAVLDRSTCLRRKYGAIIVKNPLHRLQRRAARPRQLLAARLLQPRAAQYSERSAL